ncbi:MAG: glycosyltransferase [Bacteroidia bacterium]
MTSPSRKKLLFIAPVYPYRGGNVLFITYLYENLSTEFEIIIFNYKLLYPSLFFPGKTQFDTSKKVKKIPSERLIHSLNPLNWLYVAWRINAVNPDLVIFDWWHPYFAPCHFFISFFLKKNLKKRIVFITENYISHENHFIDRILTKIGLSQAQYFIALSGEMEKQLKQNFPRKKIFRSELPIYDHLADEYVDSSSLREKFSLALDARVLLFFGYVRKYKGLDLLIQALAHLKNTSPPYTLLVAGEFYEDKTFYVELIEQLGLKEQVQLYDEYIPNEKVKDFFLVSDVVVLPYRSATQSGILNLAYGFRKPVIATKVGGLSEFVQDKTTGLLVEEPTPQAIAKSIEEFYQLRKEVDFEKNIDTHIHDNRFHEFRSIIREILAESSA